MLPSLFGSRVLTAAALAALLASASLPGSTQAANDDKELAAALSNLQSTQGSFARGRAWLAKQDLTKAAGEFEACLAVFPAHVYAAYYLANIHYARRDYTAALAAIENAERHLDFMAALDAFARKRKIQALEETKDVLEAQNEARTSCRESRALEQMVLDVETAESKALDREARDKALRLRQASQYAYFHGNVLFQLKDFEAAFQAYDRAVRIDPGNGDAYNNAAAILAMAGKPREASALLQRAVTAGVEDRINLKLKKLVVEGLGESSAGILEEEFAGENAGGVVVMRFSINPYEGRPDRAPLFVNTYVVFDPGSRDAVIIDPGAADPRLEAYIEAKGLKPRLILNTHGHYDHRRGDAHYAGRYAVKVAVPKEDASFYRGAEEDPGEKVEPIFISPEMRAGALTIKAFPTPGHTPGGVCFLIGGCLFSGDSLFEDGIGRIAAGGSGERKAGEALVRRLDELLARLPAETPILPGHLRATTPARVRELNPYLKKGR